MGNAEIQFEKQSERAIKNIRLLDGHVIEVVFTNGTVKNIDLSSLFALHNIYAPLKDDYKLFSKMHVAPGGYAIKWNSDIDIGSEYIWENGDLVQTVFDDLLSMSEATKLWGLSESTFRKALSRGKLIENVDAKKFAGQWVLSKGAIEREYGLSIPDQIAMHQKSLAEYENSDSWTMKYYTDHPEEAYRISDEIKEIEKEIKRLKLKIEGSPNLRRGFV